MHHRKQSAAARTSPNVDQLMLLKFTMRLRPDRICLGEARGPEALALLKAWNTGHQGGVCRSTPTTRGQA